MGRDGMRIPLIDLTQQNASMYPAIAEQMREVIFSGKYVLGEQVSLFEKECAEYLGVPHAIGVANGTDALVLTLEALGIGEGDEVITSPYTFFASAESIARVGAWPVFVDVDSKTYNMDPLKLEEKITKKTKAIIVVHIFGQCADMDQIGEIAKVHGLYVIEDACQAMGATYKGRKAGTMGDVGCISFFPTKNLGGIGDGGMLVTAREQIDKECRRLRAHGSVKKYVHRSIGYNSRLDELQAAILRVKLPYLDDWNEARRKIAAVYNESLPIDSVPAVDPRCTHIYHIYNLKFDSEKKRDAMRQLLYENEIATGVYYPIPLHLQEAFWYLGYEQGSLPIAEELSKQLLAIPMFPEMSKAQQQKILRVLTSKRELDE